MRTDLSFPRQHCGYPLCVLPSWRIIVWQNRNVFRTQYFGVVRAETIHTARSCGRQPEFRTCVCCFLSLNVNDHLLILNFAEPVKWRFDAGEPVNPLAVFPTLPRKILLPSVAARFKTQLPSHGATITVAILVYGSRITLGLPRGLWPVIEQTTFSQPAGDVPFFLRIEPCDESCEPPSFPGHSAWSTDEDIFLDIDGETWVRIPVPMPFGVGAAVKKLTTPSLGWYSQDGAGYQFTCKAVHLRSTRIGTVFSAMNFSIASAGMRTALPQRTKGKFLRRRSQARRVAGFSPRAALASLIESNFVI
jgi:hypothetical protein